MKKAVVAAALLALSSQALAETLTLGWMNIQPCSKTEWDNRGPLGLPSPTVRWGEQRATLYLSIDAPNFQRVQAELKHCAERGVAAATLAALIANVSAAAPAFSAEFQSCARNVQWMNASLSVNTSCHY